MLVGDVLTAAGRDGAAAGAYGRARAINFNAAVATRLVAAQRRAGQLEAALSTARAFANANPHSTTGAASRRRCFDAVRKLDSRDRQL